MLIGLKWELSDNQGTDQDLPPLCGIRASRGITSPKFEKPGTLLYYRGKKGAFELVGIVCAITGSKWGRIYRFEEYFKVFE